MQISNGLPGPQLIRPMEASESQRKAGTVEPLNKGHFRTEAIVPYSEVVPYWEVFQKKSNNDVKSPLRNRELISSALFQWEHYSTSSCWHERYTNNHGSKENST